MWKNREKPIFFFLEMPLFVVNHNKKGDFFS